MTILGSEIAGRYRLDRRLGAQLLRYGLFGTAPREPDIATQIHTLGPLKRLLELDGYDCQAGASVDGVPVPLLVARDGRRVAIGTKSCFVEGQPHSLEPLEKKGVRVAVLNDYVLRQNLPDEHQLIRHKFS